MAVPQSAVALAIQAAALAWHGWSLTENQAKNIAWKIRHYLPRLQVSSDAPAGVPASLKLYSELDIDAALVHVSSTQTTCPKCPRALECRAPIDRARIQNNLKAGVAQVHRFRVYILAAGIQHGAFEESIALTVVCLSLDVGATRSIKASSGTYQQ